MNVIIALEHRFDRTPDGTVWTQTMFAQSFWMRYLTVFDHVRVVARVRNVLSVPPDWKAASGEHISFAAIPYYLGPWQYLRMASRVSNAARAAVGTADAVILRVSSQIAACIEPSLRRVGHPYAVEVVGDPYDVFAPGSVNHPLRPFFRWWITRQLQQQCKYAAAAAYVTEYTLQRRYPPAPYAFSTHYSNVELPDSAFVPAPRSPKASVNSFTLIMVGSLAQLYKGPDVLLEAFARCISTDLDLNLIVIGDGKYRTELESRAVGLGVNEKVQFLGQLTAGEAVQLQLDRADLFVLPSKTEGLPRAMIEAMARGLPCIGSSVGGIPELLSIEDMVPPGDAIALATIIREVLTDKARMAKMSVRNLEKAKLYHEDMLQKRRTQFYHEVRERTETWVKANMAEYEF